MRRLEPEKWGVTSGSEGSDCPWCCGFFMPYCPGSPSHPLLGLENLSPQIFVVSPLTSQLLSRLSPLPSSFTPASLLPPSASLKTKHKAFQGGPPRTGVPVTLRSWARAGVDGGYIGRQQILLEDLGWRGELGTLNKKSFHTLLRY